jgi:exopolysaccharide biosynthesis polyprenyl glycosylphosphotransferase
VVPVREVVLDRDVRAPLGLSPGILFRWYYLRRALGALVLICLDVAAVQLAAFIGPPVWRAVGLTVQRPRLGESLWATLIVVGVSALAGLYGGRTRRRGLLQILKAAVAILLVLGPVMMFTTHSIYSKSAVFIWVSFVALDALLRLSYYRLLDGVFGAARARRPAIVVGRPEHCERVAGAFAASAVASEMNVTGVVTDGPVTDEWRQRTGLRQLGTLDDLGAVVRREHPLELVIGDPDLVKDRMLGILDLCRREHLTCRMAAPDLGFDGAAVSYVPGFGMPVFVVKPETVSGTAFIAKRVIDVSLAGLGVLLLSPLMAVIALAVKLTSPGPVLYASERVGLGQRRFRCFKFRTMYPGAETRQAALEAHNEASGAIFKIRGDPRVTPVGRLLRRFSLDELPQLLNVVRGDMSIVGPRPLPMRDNELMEDWHKRRHVVLPGITGPWQISGRSDLGFEEMIQLDFRYIENWSLTSDLRIMARTVATVFAGKGAY